MRAPASKGRFQAEEVWLPFSESVFDWDDRFHELLLNDRIRVEAYHAAISRAVKPGATVLDLGTGTGILALWALEAGARRVYGIEMNRTILDIAVDRMAAAGYSERFVPICGLSFNVTLPEPVDVLISEIIGNLADNENFVPILSDATDRFLRPGGKQIPRRVVSYIVPVEARLAHVQLEQGTWKTIGQSSAAQRASVQHQKRGFDLYYDVIVPFSCYLAEPKELRRFDGSWGQAPTYTTQKVWQTQREGVLTGFKGYFVAELADGVILDISGDDVDGRMSSDSWKHAYLPIETPIPLEAGDTVHLNFSRTIVGVSGSWRRQVYSWSGRVRRMGREIGRFHQSTGQDGNRHV